MILTCSHCGGKVQIPPALLGRTGRCPRCHQEVHVPAALPRTASQTQAPTWNARRLAEQGLSAGLAILFHVAVMVFFAFLTLDLQKGESGGHEVGIAELPGEKLTQSAEGSLEAPPRVEEPAAEPLTPAAPVESAPPTDAAAAAEELQHLVPSGSSSSDGGPGLEIPLGGGRMGSGSFMGVPGKGQRFCIIADRSGSMSGAKMEYVKGEILKTIGDLRGRARFFVVFFDDRAEPMPGGRWLEGRNAGTAASWIKGIHARGGTEPVPGFQVAFALDPKPDVIYFMTDGLFGSDVPARVAQLNGPGKKVTIHTISFVDKSAEHLMRQIAEATPGGKYRHVDGP